MRSFLAYAASVILACACGGDRGGGTVDAPAVLDAAAVDAGCGGQDAAVSDQVRVGQALIGCGCCSEGSQACVDVTVFGAGLVTAVGPGPTNPAADPVVGCVAAALFGACLQGYAGTTQEVCQWGL